MTYSRQTPDYFVQAVPVSRRDGPRSGHLEERMTPQMPHLHVGCADWPIFDPTTNLHLRWLREGRVVDGLDPAEDVTTEMAQLLPGARYFSSVTDEVRNRGYGGIVIPETIEHVDNVGAFLAELSTVTAEWFAITTPNAMAMHAYEHESVVYETVHPDHNCWYSPFTLVNVIRKYAPRWTVTEVLIVDDGGTLIARGAAR